MLLSKSKAEIETFRILRGGKNSLDFQLSTYLGYLVMENCYKKIFIVSQDKGFLCAISFWEENSDICNAEIKLCKSISNAELENSTSKDYDDGLTGKFLEKVDVKKQPNKVIYEDEAAGEEVDDINNSPISKSSASKSPVSKSSASRSSRNKSSTEFELQNERLAHTYRDKSKGNFADKNSAYKNFIYKIEKESDDVVTRRNIIKTYVDKAKSTMVRTHVDNKPKSDTDKTYVDNKPKSGTDKTHVDNKSKSGTDKTYVNKVVSVDESQDKVNKNVQNPTSKNKIFAAEVKLNITDDVKEIISGKYDDKYVPVLVEAIGKSTGKQHLYRMLVSKFGQERGYDIYMMIKGQYANLKRK
jgi:hypothetical protein